MVLALVAIPLVVLIQQLSLLKLLEAIRQHDVSVLFDSCTMVGVEFDSCSKEREQRLVDILMPHNIQNQLFAAYIVALIVKRIGGLLFNVLKNLTNVHFVSEGHQTSVALCLAAVVAGVPRA